jgi:hypothetical protein
MLSKYKNMNEIEFNFKISLPMEYPEEVDKNL